MLDLLLRIADRCIELLKRREERNRVLYVNFVRPTFEELQCLHENYLERFWRYRELLNDSSQVLTQEHSMFDDLRGDSLFSKGFRDRVIDINIPAKDSLVGDFIRSIEKYLFSIYPANAAVLAELDKEISQGRSAFTDERIADLSIGLYHDLANIVQVCVDNDVKRILSSPMKEDDKRRLSIKAIDRYVSVLQRRYQNVVHEHVELRSRLLKPK